MDVHCEDINAALQIKHGHIQFKDDSGGICQVSFIKSLSSLDFNTGQMTIRFVCLDMDNNTERINAYFEQIIKYIPNFMIWEIKCYSTYSFEGDLSTMQEKALSSKNEYPHICKILENIKSSINGAGNLQNYLIEKKQTWETDRIFWDTHSCTTGIGNVVYIFKIKISRFGHGPTILCRMQNYFAGMQGDLLKCDEKQKQSYSVLLERATDGTYSENVQGTKSECAMKVLMGISIVVEKYCVKYLRDAEPLPFSFEIIRKGFNESMQ